MAERFDPLTIQEKWVLDHYARYLFSRPLATNKRVLDIACGFGYGSKILAEAHAGAVIGIDISPETIEYARTKYPHPKVEYYCDDFLLLNPEVYGRFDLITCFETLEHVQSPETALHILASLMAPDGVLIISVPNDIALNMENPYHLIKFTQAEFLSLLLARFSRVEAYYQSDTMASLIWKVTDFEKVQLTSKDSKLQQKLTDVSVYYHGDISEDTAIADCFLAICTNNNTELQPPLIVQSNWLWRAHNKALWAEVQKVGQAWEQQKEYIESTLNYIEKLQTEKEQLWQEIQKLGQAWHDQNSTIQALTAEKDRYWQEVEKIGGAWEQQQEFIKNLQVEIAKLEQEQNRQPYRLFRLVEKTFLRRSIS